ncbi:MAG: leucine-rich repeat protein [Eubacterium sp.]|nr:leucine-rich repeat protein [Eubacterium sp.]
MSRNKRRAAVRAAAAFFLAASLALTGCGLSGGPGKGAVEESTGADGGSTDQGTVQGTDQGGAYSRALAMKNQTYEKGSEELAVTKEGKNLPAGKKDYTIMIYMVGSNLESQFGAASADLKEITEAGYDSGKVNVIVYTGGSQRWTSSIPSTCNNVLDMGREQDQRIVAQTEASADMGVADTFSTFINFAVKNYPADHYALICWDHGGGPLWGYGSDELFNYDSLLLGEIKEGMDKTPFAKKKKLDWVGFDACLMGSVENAILWKDYAAYLVASEEIEAGDGWDYSFLKNVNGQASTEEIVSSIVKSYGDYYEASKTQFSDPDATLSAMDLSATEDLITGLDKLLKGVDGKIGKGEYAKISKCREKAKYFGLATVDGKGQGYDLIDLGSLCDELSDLFPQETEDLKTAIGKMVVSESSNVEKTSGISIYFPGNNIDLYKEVGKGAFSSVGVSDTYKSFIRNYASSWLDIKKVDWTLKDWKVTKKELTMKLTPEQTDMISGAYYSILQKSGSGYLITTSQIRVEPDEKGVVHVPADPRLITVETDSGRGGSPWTIKQTQTDEKGSDFKTLACYLSPGQDFNDLDPHEDPFVDVNMRMDAGDGHVDITSINLKEEGIGLGGKNGVDVSRYHSILNVNGSILTPTREDNGHMKPFYEWKSGGYLYQAEPIDAHFRFVALPASSFDRNFVCQLLLQDVNGQVHGSDITDLPEQDKTAERTVDTEKGSMTFELADGKARWINYKGEDQKLTLPEEVDGCPVTSVGQRVFYDKETEKVADTVISLTFPDSLEEIDVEAFSGIRSLTSVKFGRNLKKIGSYAFQACGITKIDLPDSLKVLGREAFGSTLLTEAEIPAGIESVGAIPFGESGELKAIRVKGRNKAVTEKDGVLFSADGKTLIQYPNAKGKKYTVPDGTLTIGYGAFGHTNIEEITFADSVETIAECSFFGCGNIKSLVLPKNLKELGGQAFGDIVLYGDFDERPYIKEVVIPAGVTRIGSRPFDVLNIGAFRVEKGNRNYASAGGFITNKKKETILYTPMGIKGTVKIPEGVIGLSDRLFKDYPDETQFTLPDSLSRIPDDVFPYGLGEEKADGTYEEIYKITIHCNEGSKAEQYAKKHDITYDHEMDAGEEAGGSQTVKTDHGTITFDLYKDHAALVSYKGSDETLVIPEKVKGKKVTILGNGKDSIQPETDSTVYEEGSGQSSLLHKLVLPKTLTTIRKKAFSYMSALREISVEKGSRSFSARDGILFNADGTTLVYFPANKINPYTGEDKKTDYQVPDGTKVIGADAFSGAFDLTEVTLPDSLESVEDAAFEGCYNLTAVHGGDQISSLGKSAFESCSNLKEVPVFNNLKEIPQKAFYATGLEKVVIGDQVTKIGDDAFGSLDHLTQITMGKKVETIGSCAFLNIANTTTDEKPPDVADLKLPASVKEIGRSAFSGLKISNFEVDKKNSFFSTKDGMLLSADGSIFYCCPANRKGTVKVPEGVKTIVVFAFYQTPEVTDVYIPDSVLNIENGAFDSEYVDDEKVYRVTLHCKAGSDAAEFAKRSGIPWKEK